MNLLSNIKSLTTSELEDYFKNLLSEQEIRAKLMQEGASKEKTEEIIRKYYKLIKLMDNLTAYTYRKIEQSGTLSKDPDYFESKKEKYLKDMPEFVRKYVSNRLEGNMIYSKTNTYENMVTKFSPMAKFLGYTAKGVSYGDAKLTLATDGLNKIDASESELQVFRKHHEANYRLNNNNIKDSLQLKNKNTDLNILRTNMLNNINAQSNTNKTKSKNIFSSTSVHPVFMMLYTLLNSTIEGRFVYSDLGRALIDRAKTKMQHNDTATSTREIMDADVELLYDIALDSTNNKSGKPLDDLIKRYEIQIELNKLIKKIRSGNIYSTAENYNTEIKNVESLLFQYRSAFVETPDTVVYNDGTALFRKILQVYSFRPTKINVSGVGFDKDYNPLDPNIYYKEKVNYIPIINVRLPSVVLTEKLNLPNNYNSLNGVLESNMLGMQGMQGLPNMLGMPGMMNYDPDLYKFGGLNANGYIQNQKMHQLLSTPFNLTVNEEFIEMNLQSQLNSSDEFIVENGLSVPKTKRVLASKGVLFFHVFRKASIVSLEDRIKKIYTQQPKYLEYMKLSVKDRVLPKMKIQAESQITLGESYVLNNVLVNNIDYTGDNEKYSGLNIGEAVIFVVGDNNFIYAPNAINLGDNNENPIVSLDPILYNHYSSLHGTLYVYALNK